MHLQYIVEICIAIDIAMLSIAYPLMVDRISSIGDKYSSEAIPVLFNLEFPQSGPRILSLNVSWLKISLVGTLVFCFILVWGFQSPFEESNFFIDNSARLCILISSVGLTILFLMWLDQIMLYHGRTIKLLEKIIKDHNKLEDQATVKSYYLKAINDLTLYAVRNQSDQLQKTLLEFYSRLLSDIRINHDKTKPLEYPIDIYFIIDKLTNEFLNTRSKLPALEHRVVSGVWLLGEGMERVKISRQTYSWIWHNLYVICDNDKFSKMFWANSSQYFDYKLQSISPKYQPLTTTITNQGEIDIRKDERLEFLEIHYAFGGLLLYRKQHETLKYIFRYTQSQPPKYPLLPHSMTDIFFWFEWFNNEYKSRFGPIDMRYRFPGLDNLGNFSQITFWICKYIAVLFVRQYTIQTYYVYENPTSQPNLPTSVSELNDWLSGLQYFEKCLEFILDDASLLSDLGYSNVVEDKRAEMEEFIKTLRTNIKAKIAETRINAELSQEKITTFKESSARIIAASFSSYNEVFTTATDEHLASDVKMMINGEGAFFSKSHFVEDETPLLNYDTFLAQQIDEYKIKWLVPISFSQARTKRYLFDSEILIEGLQKIINNNENIIIVIGSNLDYDATVQLHESQLENHIIEIPSHHDITREAIFILKKSDLPSLSHISLDDSEIEKDKLSLVNNPLKIYASVFEVEDTQTNADDVQGNDLKVQATIAFLATISWRQLREVIQIDLVTRFREQGIRTNLSEVDPIL